MNSDRNLLFGAIAMQTELITADQFADACSLWSMSREKSLPEILRDKGWLVPEDQAHIEYLVERRLAKFAGDIRASFAGCPAEIQNMLASIDNGTASGGILNTIAFEGPDAVASSVERTGPRYRLNKLHAAGGIGEIWLARDADLQRDVAVKRLQVQKSASVVAKTRFLREARITGQLEHPGVVPIYELCLDEASGQPYYSMRFLSGRTLTEAVAQYHAQRKKSGADSQMFLGLLNAFCIVCSTVAYAHSKGIVHRDLKCENVILGDYGEVVVIDWGLAKEVGSYDSLSTEELETAVPAGANPAATLAGQILGTPAYMAPEQASGRLDLIGPPTDVYGLSAILYEILAGRPPFVGRGALDVLMMVQHDDPIRPSDIVLGVPETLERICLKGLAKAPGERHLSAESLAKAVQAWISELAERRQSEEERERFFALSLDVLAIVDAAGRFRQVSPAWKSLLGYDPGQLIGQSFIDCIHPSDRSSAARCLGAVAHDRSADVLETKALHRDGSYRWVSWNATPIAKEQCVYVVGRDITELKKSQQLFEGVLQSAPDAMVLVNPHGLIVMVNRQMERIFGYTQEEMLGQPVELLIPERFREQHPAYVAGFFAKSGVRPMGAGLPLRGRRKDGQEFPADIAISPIITEAAKFVAASVREISERSRT